MDGEIQQLILPGMEPFFRLHIGADAVRAGVGTRVLEPHDLEQIGILVPVLFAADDAPRVEFQVRDKPIVIQRFMVRPETVFIVNDARKPLSSGKSYRKYRGFHRRAVH